MKHPLRALGLVIGCLLAVSPARGQGNPDETAETAGIPQVHLLRAEASLGTKTVTVFFTPVPIPAENDGELPALTLSLPSQAPHVLTAEELVSGRATLTLDRACTGDLPITLRITDPTQQATTSETVTSTEIPSWPEIGIPLKEGAESVSGTIGPGFTQLDVRLWRPGTQLGEMKLPQGSEPHRVPNLVERQVVPIQGPTFSVRLASRLAAGAIVQVCPVEEGSSPPRPVAARCVGSMVQGLEWGPVSARFTVGALFSQKDSNNSGSLDDTTSYVGLEVATAWSSVHSTGWLRHVLPPAFAVQSSFEARLTQTGASEQGAGGDPNEASVVARQACVFQASLSLPMFKKLAGYALFAAPIGKIGIQAIPKGFDLRYGVTTDADGTPVIAKDAAGQPVVLERSSIAPAWSAGVRLGMGQVQCRPRTDGYRQESHATTGDDPIGPVNRGNGQSVDRSRLEQLEVVERRCRPGKVISHIDILIGQYQNYRVTDLTTGLTSSPLRAVIEGRLAAPDLPFELGFDVNLRLSALERTPHDYRIFVALRFDAASALAKAFGAALPGQ